MKESDKDFLEASGLPQTNEPEKEDNRNKWHFLKEYKWYFITAVILIILLLFFITKEVNALDKASLCGNLSLTSINDCDEFWDFLTNKTATVITTMLNYTTFQIINNETIINNTLIPNEDIEILREKNRHDEAIAKIDKGIIDNNGSQSIITSDFARKSDLQSSLEGALATVIKKEELQTKLEEFYLQKFGNTTIPQTEIKEELKWYETPGALIAGVLVIFGGIYLYQRRGKFKLNSQPSSVDPAQESFFKDLAKNINPSETKEGQTKTIENKLLNDEEKKEID